MVKRERDGKEGYILIAPFVTSVGRVHRKQQKMVENTILVNMGWVPREQLR